MLNVYKYLPPERIGYLDDALMRLSPPGALNDPFECLPGFPDSLGLKALEYLNKLIITPPSCPPGTSRAERRIADRCYKKIVKHRTGDIPHTVAELSERYYAHVTESMNTDLGVLSLSRRWDSSLMWSHYTGSHTGFCVGFDREHTFFQNPQSALGGDVPIAPVVYLHERPIVPEHTPDRNTALRNYLTKSKDWEYEAEERLVGLLRLAKKTIEAKPFNIALFEVPHIAITELVVGVRASPEIISQVRAASRRLKVPMFKAIVSRVTYDVERTQIEV